MDAGQAGGVAQALEAALADVQLQPRDGAMVELARTLALHIDAGQDDLPKLAPQLANVLDALLMSPRARAAIKKGVAGERKHSELDALRERRRARIDGAPAVDTPAS